MNVMQTKNIEISPVNVEHRKNLDLRAGDTVRVWTKVEEKGKTRLQAFEGLVLARKHGSEPGATFTVRRVASGVGVERIFPLYSPNIDKIELIKRARARRSKLYYIREKAAKEIRRKMKALHIDLPDFMEKAAEATTTEAEEEKNSSIEATKGTTDEAVNKETEIKDNKEETTEEQKEENKTGQVATEKEGDEK